MRDFSDPLAEVRRRVAEAQARAAELEAQASEPGLWDDPDRARALTTELARARDDVELIEALDRRVSDVEPLCQLSREESDDSFEPEIDTELRTLSDELDQLEL